jgi:hypothetical protein
MDCRRHTEAKAAYRRVLDLIPAHPTALAFLGLTCHITGELDEAILRYHEVRVFPLPFLTRPERSRTGAERGRDQPSCTGLAEHGTRRPVGADPPCAAERASEAGRESLGSDASCAAGASATGARAGYVGDASRIGLSPIETSAQASISSRHDMEMGGTARAIA